MGTMEIESALVANPLVAEAAVVGRPDDLTGEAFSSWRIASDEAVIFGAPPAKPTCEASIRNTTADGTDVEVTTGMPIRLPWAASGNAGVPAAVTASCTPYQRAGFITHTRRPPRLSEAICWRRPRISVMMFAVVVPAEAAVFAAAA